MVVVKILALCIFVTASFGAGPQERLSNILHKINRSPYLRAQWEKHLKQFENPDEVHRSKFDHYTFSCEQQASPTTPTSVHRLRPADIKVVASLGDSITAGNGILAWTILGCLTNYRGRSWSIGGDREYSNGVTTLPNILRNLNPDLHGYSLDKGDADSNGANLNVAVAGAIAQDMPGQAHELVRRLNADHAASEMDMENDWKVITLFIGGNNLCDFCNDLERHSAENYIGSIREALDILHNNVPRAFVNLVQIFDVTPVAGLSSGTICNIIHGAVCGCGHGSNADPEGLTELSRQYQRVTEDLVNSGRYDTREDFTVVMQPFFRDTAPPLKENSDEPDLSYFAPDCFHFSEKGHQVSARALWNAMLTPIGSKRTEWRLDDYMTCPTQARPYLATRLN